MDQSIIKALGFSSEKFKASDVGFQKSIYKYWLCFGLQGNANILDKDMENLGLNFGFSF